MGDPPCADRHQQAGFDPAMDLDHNTPLRSVIDPASLSLTQAVFLAENPQAIERDFAPADRPRVAARMDALFARAREEQPLLWQAYRARCARRPAASVRALADKITAYAATGGTPANTPTLPA
jgi:hypothetical protein